LCPPQPDKKSPEAQVNLENAMMRYEFIEAIVRAALAKYGKGQATDDIAVAVRMILENNIVANLPAPAAIVTNDFRTGRLYCEEVDLLLKRHAVMLKAIYSRCEDVSACTPLMVQAPQFLMLCPPERFPLKPAPRRYHSFFLDPELWACLPLIPTPAHYR
jgi:hypothetical protein